MHALVSGSSHAERDRLSAPGRHDGLCAALRGARVSVHAEPGMRTPLRNTPRTRTKGLPVDTLLGIAGLGLLLYLFVSVLRPEWF